MKEIKGLISIARKAGFVIIGQENLAEYDKKLFLFLMDNSAGKSLKREMNFLSKTRDVPLEVVENLADLVAIENCKVIGIKNKKFSENILECLKKGE